MQQEYLYHYVVFYNIETQEKNLIHKVETIAACITFLRHRRRRRRRRRCLCGNSSEQYSIALDSIISIRGCDREALDRSSSSIAASPECAAQERRQLCTAIYSCLVRRRRRRRERSEVFASTAYLLTWSWLLTDCPGTYVRTQQARAVQEVPLHCTVQWYMEAASRGCSSQLVSSILQQQPRSLSSFAAFVRFVLSLFLLFSLLALAAHNAKACMRTKHSWKNGPIFFFLSFFLFFLSLCFEHYIPKVQTPDLWPFVRSLFLYYTLLTWSMYHYVVLEEIQSHPENRREVARIHLQPHHNAIANANLCSIAPQYYIARQIHSSPSSHILAATAIMCTTAVHTALLHSALAMPGVMQCYTGLCSQLATWLL